MSSNKLHLSQPNKLPTPDDLLRIHTPRALTRRAALRNIAWGAALPFIAPSVLLAAGATATGAYPNASDVPHDKNSAPLKTTHQLKLGVATISLHALSLDAAIAVLKRLDLKYISLYKTHAPWGSDPDKCRAAAEKVRAAGLTLMATGVVNLPNDEAVVEKAFACAEAAHLPVMTCRPDPAAFSLIERYVKKHDIKLAIHNHGPEDKIYPSPIEAWKLIQAYDARIGLCMDVGHSTRAGVDSVAAIKKCAPRIYDFHIKDTIGVIGKPDIPVEIGRGYIDIPAVLRALVDVNYAYQVGIENEVDEVKGHEKEDPIPSVAEDAGYLRGVLRALS